MSDTGADFWTDDTSVLFTSFWGWNPETWATVGWSRREGRSYRDNLLKRISDPFVAVIYVTRDPRRYNRDLVGKVVGFFLMSHRTGHRNEFTHPVYHGQFTEKWEHSLQALRAFSYISDPLPDAKKVEPRLRKAGQAFASWGQILTDRRQIEFLRGTPWREVPIYRPDFPAEAVDDVVPPDGMVHAGPAAMSPYLVSPSAASLGRRLYVLRLNGDTDAYIGKFADGRAIYKIGIGVSPDGRRRDLQKAMPQGAFWWQTERADPGDGPGYTFEAAVAGEYAMKKWLAVCSEHLGGEFYLATEEQIEEAWRRGIETARKSENA